MEKLTIEDVKKSVSNIEKMKFETSYGELAWLEESAHIAEDELYTRVLTAISTENCENPVELAKEALKTQELDFCHWFSEKIP